MRGEERDHAGDPGHRPPAAPGGHPELAPQVDDHEDEEQLHAPEVQAVGELTQRRRVVPGRPAKASTRPETRITRNAARVSTPKT